MKAAELLGLGRSLLIYRAIPGRARRLREFYARFVNEGDLCIDAGAHVGNHTRAFLELGARAVALEPQPRFAGLLRKWYGGNPKVTVLEQALGAEAGEATLQLSERTPTVSSLSGEWVERVSGATGFAGVRWEGRQRVKVTTLDAILEAHGEPAFCKLDVEGYELEALRGLSRPVRALSFEYLPATLDIALDCVGRMETLGRYEYNLTRGESRKLLLPGWVEANEVIAHWQALPRGSRSGDVIARLRN